MYPVLVGSTALAYHLDKLKITHNINPLDIDFIAPSESGCNDIVNKLSSLSGFEQSGSIRTRKFSVLTKIIKIDGTPVEISYPESDSCSTMHLISDSALWGADITEVLGVKCIVAPIDVLYSLKMSHRFLRNSPHFLKTMKTIRNIRLMRPNIKPHSDEWLKMRESETYDYSHPNLKVGKADFFNSNFNYIYDHDSLHESVKLMDRPAYTFYMDDHEVNCSKHKFFSNDITVRLLGVLEEAYVLALERSQIPNDFNVDPKISFNIALEKVCTSITSGWFRDFAWEHYDIVQQLYTPNYVDKFKYSLSKGYIKPYKG